MMAVLQLSLNRFREISDIWVHRLKAEARKALRPIVKEIARQTALAAAAWKRRRFQRKTLFIFCRDIQSLHQSIGIPTTGAIDLSSFKLAPQSIKRDARSTSAQFHQLPERSAENSATARSCASFEGKYSGRVGIKISQLSDIQPLIKLAAQPIRGESRALSSNRKQQTKTNTTGSEPSRWPVLRRRLGGLI